MLGAGRLRNIVAPQKRNVSTGSTPSPQVNFITTTSAPTTLFKAAVMSPESVELRTGKGNTGTPAFRTDRVPPVLQSPRDDFPKLYVASTQWPGNDGDTVFGAGIIATEIRKVVDAELTKYGAILFRGLPLMEPDEYSKLVDALNYTRLEYSSPFSSRTKVAEGIDAAVNVPGNTLLAPHNEHAYMHSSWSPDKILFYAKKAAEEGGETTLVKNQELTELLGKEFVEAAERHGGIKYINRFASSKAKEAAPEGSTLRMLPTWDVRYNVASDEDRSALETRLRQEQHYEVSWGEPDHSTLTTSITLPLTRSYPDIDNGKPMWHNLAHLGSFPAWSITWADGEEIDAEVSARCRDALYCCAVGFKLGAGDLLVMDNRQVMHGRMPYEGSDRQLWVVLLKD